MSAFYAGTYVRFQPRSADFQRDVGADLEQVLSAAMLTRSTLTEGQWVQVEHAGTVYSLKVLSLQPAPAVSIVGEHLGVQYISRRWTVLVQSQVKQYMCMHSASAAAALLR